MQKGMKFRIYPNREQKNLINQTLGCCRLVYNRGLAMREDAFKNGNKVGYAQTSTMLTGLKKCEDFAFLKAVDSIALQQTLRDLDRGYVNFFQKRAAHPTFKANISLINLTAPSIRGITSGLQESISNFQSWALLKYVSQWKPKTLSMSHWSVLRQESIL